MKFNNFVTFRNFLISTGRLSLRSDRLRSVNFDANNRMGFYACAMFDAITRNEKNNASSLNVH